MFVTIINITNYAKNGALRPVFYLGSSEWLETKPSAKLWGLVNPLAESYIALSHHGLTRKYENGADRENRTLIPALEEPHNSLYTISAKELTSLQSLAASWQISLQAS